MKLRRLKHHVSEKHGHYDVCSYRQDGNEASRYGPLTIQEFRQNHRIRVGISRNSPWRDHV